MIVHLLATWIPALLIALSGVMKLSGHPKILEGMTTLGVGRYVRLLGVMELAFAIHARFRIAPLPQLTSPSRRPVNPPKAW